MSDGTQYLIDIAAKMDGGEDAISKLIAVSDGLAGVGKSAATFDAAIAKTKAALAASGEAAAAAADDLAAGEQKYRQMERAAVNAAKALERAGQKTSGAVPADLAQKAAAAQAALTGEAKALDNLRAKSAAAAASQQRLAGALKNLEGAGRQAKRLDELSHAAAMGTGEFGPMSSALGQLGGPLGVIGNKVTAAGDAFANLSKTLGTGPGAIVTVAVLAAAAVATLTVAVVAAIAKTAQWAVGLANTKRELALTLEGLGASSAALAGLSGILPGLQRDTGLAADQLAKMAEQLDAAKVGADAMPDALRAIAVATAGGASGKFLSKLQEDLKLGRKSAADLAREVDQKFGGIVKRRMLGLSQQSETLKRNLGETFGGLKIEGLLKEFDRLVKLFDASTVSGQTMKFLFEKMLQPLIDALVKAGPIAERFFLGVQIGAMKIYLALQPAIKSVKKLLGESDTDLVDGLKLAELAGKGVAAGIAAVVTALALVAAAAALVVAPLVLIGITAMRTWETFRNGVAGVVGFLQSVSLSELGTQMVQGLANGIKSAGSKVLDAITGVVNSAIASAKKLLGIASPSKVFEGIGVNVGEGFTGGVEGEGGAAKSALESLVEPPSPKPGGGPDATKGGAMFDFSGATLVFNGVKDAPHSVQMFGDMVTRVLEGDLEQLGGQPPEEP